MGRSKLQLRYYDPKRVGSYGGVAALRKVVPKQDVERWLSKHTSLHKPVRCRFKRRCVVVGGPNQQWQADLVDMSRLKKVNDGITFILTDRCVFETSLVRSAKEQVGSHVGGGLYAVARQRGTEHIAN